MTFLPIKTSVDGLGHVNFFHWYHNNNIEKFFELISKSLYPPSEKEEKSNKVPIYMKKVRKLIIKEARIRLQCPDKISNSEIKSLFIIKSHKKIKLTKHAGIILKALFNIIKEQKLEDHPTHIDSFAEYANSLDYERKQYSFFILDKYRKAIMTLSGAPVDPEKATMYRSINNDLSDIDKRFGPNEDIVRLIRNRNNEPFF